jgi:hypothetical protein
VKLPPLETWEFWHFVRKEFGLIFLQKIYQRGHTQLYRWSRNPRFHADTERNPLDRYEDVLKDLVDAGHLDVARAAVARQARIVGCELRQSGDVVPDQDDWRDEILDDYPMLAQYHEACRDFVAGRRLPETVQHLQDEVIREIRETTAKVLSQKVIDE